MGESLRKQLHDQNESHRQENEQLRSDMRAPQEQVQALHLSIRGGAAPVASTLASSAGGANRPTAAKSSSIVTAKREASVLGDASS
eukprot:14775311-Alexandrium_andersonii.AAC.1